VDETLVNIVILCTWIISLHSTRFAEQVVVQLKVAFDAFPTFDGHDISNGAVIARIVFIPT
jgi:hypothetical protein